jgi:hypothetical protein
MKKPFFQCTSTAANEHHGRDERRAQGVSKPIASSTPPPISATPAASVPAAGPEAHRLHEHAGPVGSAPANHPNTF